MTVYLNTYETWQAYGGPEEGGWWYEAGSPVQSVFLSDEDLEQWLDKQDSEELRQMRENATLVYTRGEAPTPSKTGYGGYVFNPGSDEPSAYREDNNFRSYFEEHYGEAFPQERPYYC